MDKNWREYCHVCERRHKGKQTNEVCYDFLARFWSAGLFYNFFVRIQIAPDRLASFQTAFPALGLVQGNRTCQDWSKRVFPSTGGAPRANSDRQIALSPPHDVIAVGIKAGSDQDLNPFTFTEFAPGHPFSGRLVAAVVTALCCTAPSLMCQIANARPDVYRRCLSDLGKVVAEFSSLAETPAELQLEVELLARDFRSENDPFAEGVLERLRPALADTERFPRINKFVYDYVVSQRVARDNPALAEEKMRLAFFPLAGLLNLFSQKVVVIATFITFYLWCNGLNERGLQTMQVRKILQSTDFPPRHCANHTPASAQPS
jgi:hypothetical protein